MYFIITLLVRLISWWQTSICGVTALYIFYRNIQRWRIAAPVVAVDVNTFNGKHGTDATSILISHVLMLFMICCIIIAVYSVRSELAEGLGWLPRGSSKKARNATASIDTSTSSNAVTCVDPRSLSSMEAIQSVQNAMSYYDVLQLTTCCTPEQIKRNYKVMSLRVHPDKHDDDSTEAAAQAFLVVNKAHDVLSNPESREVYDRYLSKGMGGVTKEEEEARQQRSSLAMDDEKMDEFRMVFADLIDKLERASHELPCPCNRTHRRRFVDRSVRAARYCNKCVAFHAAKDGDGWFETPRPLWDVLMGRMTAYAVMNNHVWDVTDWVRCQGLKAPPDMHVASFSINGVKDNRTQNNDVASFFEDLKRTAATQAGVYTEGDGSQPSDRHKNTSSTTTTKEKRKKRKGNI